MVTVTEGARQLLKEILAVHSDEPEMGARLVLNPEGGLGLELSQEEPGDEVVKHEGAKVLLVSPELQPALEEITLDVEDADDGRKLVVRE